MIQMIAKWKAMEFLINQKGCFALRSQANQSGFLERCFIRRVYMYITIFDRGRFYSVSTRGFVSLVVAAKEYIEIFYPSWVAALGERHKISRRGEQVRFYKVFGSGNCSRL